MDAGAGLGAPRLPGPRGLQAGAGAASRGAGCLVSPPPLSGLPGTLILCKQSWSIACVLGSLSQHRKSSSTFIFRTGCRTLPGGISGTRRPPSWGTPFLPHTCPGPGQNSGLNEPPSGLRPPKGSPRES